MSKKRKLTLVFLVIVIVSLLLLGAVGAIRWFKLADENSSCVLMEEIATGRIDCFGCAGGLCKDPVRGWVVREGKSSQCVVTPSGGCALKK